MVGGINRGSIYREIDKKGVRATVRTTLTGNGSTDKREGVGFGG